MKKVKEGTASGVISGVADVDTTYDMDSIHKTTRCPQRDLSYMTKAANSTRRILRDLEVYISTRGSHSTWWSLLQSILGFSTIDLGVLYNRSWGSLQLISELISTTIDYRKKSSSRLRLTTGRRAQLDYDWLQKEELTSTTIDLGACRPKKGA